MSDKNVINNIAQINIVVADKGLYNNGDFIPVFTQEYEAILSNEKITDKTARILGILICNVDSNNRITTSIRDVAKELKCNESTVYRALKILERMQIICHSGNKHGRKYELSTKLMNPRLAFYGNTRRLVKEQLPLLMTPDGETPLLPNVCMIPAVDFLNEAKETDEQINK